MKQTFAALYCFITLFVAAQSKIKILQRGEVPPVANAAIPCGGKILGSTDGAGNKKVKTIERVILKDKSDPEALEILRKVNANYAKNSPQSLDSYSFKAYEKISVDLDQDSIGDYRNFLEKHALEPGDSEKKNTNGKKQRKEDGKKLITRSKFFLWERAQEFLWEKNLGEKIIVLDNRISGFREPIYELMTLRSNRLKMPKEIREENRGLYRFFLTDTIDIDGRKNFVIRFREVNFKQPANKRKFNGSLYIDTASFALKKIESNSKVQGEGSIVSIWTPINNKWFLDKEKLRLKIGNTKIGDVAKQDIEGKVPEKGKRKFGNYVYMMTDYFDFRTPSDVVQKKFRGYTMEVQNADGRFLKKFRTDSLTQRELNTYKNIDSLGSKYRLDQKMNILRGAMLGMARMGNVDFNLGRLYKYNLYEGLRIGIGIKLNEGFSRYVSPDFYAAYGFKDTSWKYGVGIDVRTTLHKNAFFRAEYTDDVTSAGKFSENLWNSKMIYMNSGIDLKNDRFLHYQRFRLSYEEDLTNGITAKISANRENNDVKFGYNFRGLGDRFQNFSIMATLKFSPNSKNIMTPSGKYTYEQNFPEFYLNYEQALKVLGGDFGFGRLDAMALHNFRTVAGVTGFRLYGGMLTGSAPIWDNFTMNGLGSGRRGINFNLTSYIGFATMESGKYYNEKFVGTYLSHQIPWYFKSIGKNVSSFDLVYRCIIGNMQHTEYHQLAFVKLDHLYQEAGLEWNNFLSTQFNLGFFYRVGYYATPNFTQNFAIQFKLKLLGF